jgi:hypothetical protein
MSNVFFCKESNIKYLNFVSACNTFGIINSILLFNSALIAFDLFCFSNKVKRKNLLEKNSSKELSNKMKVIVL